MNFRGKNKYLLIIGFLPLFSSAQNLVPNPSFEIHGTCIDPPPNESLQNCDNWFNAVEPLTTVDWYSTCYPSGSFYLLPNLFFGFSYPHSGEAMIGLVPYSNITGIGEAVGIRLSAPMKADSAYCFGFWLKNGRSHGNTYSVREFDVAFVNDTTNIHDNAAVSSYVTVSNSIDDGNWNFLSGYYIAKGGEEFMLTGTFSPVPNYFMADPITTPENCLSYYFDDFSVQSCNKDSILSVVLELPNIFTPNGDQTNDLYLIQQNNISSLEIQIFNRWGNLVNSYDGKTAIWNGTDKQGDQLSEGVYFIKALAQTTFGEIITKYGNVELFR